MGTDGLILQVESREEILADKWVALAFRPNRIQYRDLWDILWLERQGVKLAPELVLQKVNDRHHTPRGFADNLSQRLPALNNPSHERAFRQEMARFLPQTAVRDAVDQADFWTALLLNLNEQAQPLLQSR
jgi:predicted nucleotidyltransferase component of viral defense system